MLSEYLTSPRAALITITSVLCSITVYPNPLVQSIQRTSLNGYLIVEGPRGVVRRAGPSSMELLAAAFEREV